LDVVREIQTALRTGKVVLGSKQTLKMVVTGRAKLVIIASNIPEHLRRDIVRYCKLSRTPVYEFPGTSWDLGAVCNKPFMVAAMAVLDPGDSSILELAREEGGE